MIPEGRVIQVPCLVRALWLVHRRHSVGASSRSVDRLIHTKPFITQGPVFTVLFLPRIQKVSPSQPPSPNFTYQMKSYIISLKCSLFFCLEVSLLASHPWALWAFYKHLSSAWSPFILYHGWFLFNWLNRNIEHITRVWLTDSVFYLTSLVPQEQCRASGKYL